MNKPSGKLSQAEWFIFFILILTAIAVRGLFHTGYGGSDEITYTHASFKILEGDLTVARYVGANRYGINLPVAGFAFLFGKTEFSAGIYSHLCSVLEISLMFIFGRLMFGLRCAVMTSLILIFLPIHAHNAGRLHADAPLALMISASFLFFWYGEIKNNPISFFIAGLAAGLSFWIKPVAIIYIFVFAFYPILFFQWNWRWAWMILGFSLGVISNMFLFWILADDPLFILQLFYNRPDGDAIAATFENKETSPLFYLKYLFIKIYHTWLLAYLAVAGCLLWVIQRKKIPLSENYTLKFIMLWFWGLAGLLSLFVISWSPLVFIMKQTNYMLIFIAPGTLLAGYAIAKLRGRAMALALIIIIIPSTLLVIMHQTHIHVFTANSKAAMNFAQKNKSAEIFSHTNPVRAAEYYNLFVEAPQKVSIRPISELLGQIPEQNDANKKTSKYVIIDTETLWWGSKEQIRKLSDVPACWILEGKLQSVGFGLGWKMFRFVKKMRQLMPSPVQTKIIQVIDSLTEPKPAYVYKVPESCT